MELTKVPNSTRLEAVYNTLDAVTVCGLANMAKVLGAANAVKAVAQELAEEERRAAEARQKAKAQVAANIQALEAAGPAPAGEEAAE